MADPGFKKGKLIESNDVFDVYEYFYVPGDIEPNADYTPLFWAFTKDGKEIGDKDTATMLVNKYGITEFDKSNPKNCVCSIGYSPSDGKWYGWSHRAMYGFNIGHKVKKGDVVEVEGIPAGFEVTNMGEAKHLARTFALSVAKIYDYL
jgi:hypothetical protein